MKYRSPLLVVTDMEASRTFYQKVLGLRVTMDFGANITLTGGLSLQTAESWAGFLEASQDDIAYRGKDHEIYFEEDDFDAFLLRLSQMKDIEYVHAAKEYPWGQRVVRFYDPDGHIIEVGENMEVFCQRFLRQGMSVEEVCTRTMLPRRLVEKYRQKMDE